MKFGVCSARGRLAVGGGLEIQMNKENFLDHTFTIEDPLTFCPSIFLNHIGIIDNIT